jgi:hypothetical protein
VWLVGRGVAWGDDRAQGGVAGVVGCPEAAVIGTTHLGKSGSSGEARVALQWPVAWLDAKGVHPRRCRAHEGSHRGGA